MAARRIAVFRALNLEDMLCAVPALRALRNELPEADVTLIGLPWAVAFQRRFHRYVDRFVAFPGYPGLPEASAAPAVIASFFHEMRDRAFDLCLQMHGCGPASNAVVARLGGKRAAGLGEGGGEGMLLWPYPYDCHEVRRNLHLVERCLGISEADPLLEFPLMKDDWRELRAYPRLMDCLGRRYVCLHPGARDPAKRWAPEKFAEVGDALADQGFCVVLTGCGAERPLAEQVAARMRHPAVLAACDISVGGLAALLSGARLLVSNDTGVAHVGSALGLPSVIVFFATDPMRWGPPAKGPHRIVMADRQPSAGAVTKQAMDLLFREPARRHTVRRQVPRPGRP